MGKHEYLVAPEDMTDVQMIYLILRHEMHNSRTIEAVRDQMWYMCENYPDRTFEIPLEAAMDAKMLRRIAIVQRMLKRL